MSIAGIVVIAIVGGAVVILVGGVAWVIREVSVPLDAAFDEEFDPVMRGPDDDY